MVLSRGDMTQYEILRCGTVEDFLLRLDAFVDETLKEVARGG